MSEKTRWVTLLGLLVGAVACYTIGFNFGVVFFIVVGIALELAFWVRLFRRRSSR